METTTDTEEQKNIENKNSDLVDPNEENPTHNFMDLIAKFISILFFPLFIPMYGMILLLNMNVFSCFPKSNMRVYYYIVIFFAILIPLFFYQLLAITKVISDVRMYKKEDRVIPYFLTSVSFLVGAYLLYRCWMPLQIVNIATATAIAILIDAIVSKWWQISAHMTGIGGLTAGIFCVGLGLHTNTTAILMIALLGAGLLASARLQLKRHTPLQLAAGFLNGFFSVLLLSVIKWDLLMKAISDLL